MKPTLRRSALGSVATRYAIEQLEQRRLLTGAPQLVHAWFDQTNAVQSINFQFDQDVSASLRASTNMLALDNLTTGEEFTNSVDGSANPWGTDHTEAMSWNASTDTATFTFPSYDSGNSVPGMLSDGWYQATLSAQDVANSSGQHLAQDATLNIEFLLADIGLDNPDPDGSIAGSDGIVDGADINAFDLGYAGFGPSGYYGGDFNGDGIVDGQDVNLLDLGLNEATHLNAPPSGPGQIVPNAVSSSEIDVAWAQVPNGTTSDGTPYTITGYRIERSDDGENFYKLADIDPASLDTRTISFVDGNFVFSDTSLGDGTREWYRVRAIASADGSPDSAYTPKEWAVTTLPGPTSLTATLDGSTTVDLNWTNGTNAATGLTVYAEANTDPFSPDYSGSGDGGSPTNGPSYVAIDTLPPGATSYTATDLSPDEWYRFKVVANGQWTDSSATGSNAVQTTSPPIAPADLTGTDDGTEVNLSWQNSDNSIRQILVQRSDDDGATFQTIDTASGSATSYSDSSAPVGDELYQVVAVNSFNEQAQSTTAAVEVEPKVTISGNATVSEGTAYTLHLQWSRSPDGWQVDWGDGSDPQDVATGVASLMHTYGVGGAFSIILTNDGVDDTYASNLLSLTVNGVNPNPVITLESSSTITTEVVALSSSAPSSDPIQYWDIDWGDGTSQTVSGTTISVMHNWATSNDLYKTIQGVAYTKGSESPWTATLAGLDTNGDPAPFLVASVESDGSGVELSWTEFAPVANVAGWQIQRCVYETDIGWDSLVNLNFGTDSNVPPYLDATAPLNSLIYYRMRSYNPSDEPSAWSNLFVVRTPDGTGSTGDATGEFIEMDSNNDGIIGSADGPNANASGKSGALLSADIGNSNRDGIPDYAEGYGLAGTRPDPSAAFAPLQLELPYDNALGYPLQFEFQYGASDPAGVTDTNGSYQLPANGGDLRIWDENGSSARSDQSALDGGNYIAPNTPYSYSALPTADLYVEAVKPSASLGSDTITVLGSV